MAAVSYKLSAHPACSFNNSPIHQHKMSDFSKRPPIFETMSIRVVELFAGVGGFRIGLEDYPLDPSSPFRVVWSNQWEPSTRTQHASTVYEHRWPQAHHSNKNIEEVIEHSFHAIPDHDLLVGGFPCQDYSVATTLGNSKGLKGKKGVLWWSIEAILRKKGDKKPKYLMLENVDRLLKSPANRRGRDFAVMLSSLDALGYAVEWRVINAADYGMPQRRRRTFILAYHKSSDIYTRLSTTDLKFDWIRNEGVITDAFPVTSELSSMETGTIDSDIKNVSDEFNLKGTLSPFHNSGVMIGGSYWTARSQPKYFGDRIVMDDILADETQVSEEFFISEEELNRENGWRYLKGGKKIERTNRDGFKYFFSEGGLVFPDALDGPSRTIITGEGGPSPSRFKHVVLVNGRYRRLIPLELERLNMFPDHHTAMEGISPQKRAFFMGNALVVGVVKQLGRTLAKHVNEPRLVGA